MFLPLLLDRSELVDFYVGMVVFDIAGCKSVALVDLPAVSD